jgi:tetratricopeptide (TPR) repeat protein/predicted Ser/Thr protein kinase
MARDTTLPPDRWQEVKALFGVLMDLDPAARAALLDDRCAQDLPLRAEVESLLRAHDTAGDFIATPAVVSALGSTATLEGRTIGPYRLESELGRGGMGAVYLARRADDEYRKHVAVKIIKRGMDTDEIVARFRHERQTLANLEHPNIARLLDGGTTDDGLPYFVMEYVEGRPLDEYCEEHHLSRADRLRLFRVVCGAVQFAHRNLVVHRDLKPDNILISADGSPKLLDFGISKVLSVEPEYAGIAQTRPADRLLTLDYASPEQLRGEPVSTATDVFSLGVMLYELLAGRHPFRRTDRPAHALEIAICEEDPPRPGLNADLDAIVMMAIRKEPGRRYGSALELDEDIRRYLEGLPVTAHGDALGYVAAKFVRRHKGAVAASALVAATLVAGIVGTSWQARVAQAERDRARIEASKAERVSAVLEGMLRSADPSVDRRDVTVAEVLDDTSQRIATELKDQPEVRGAVRRAIGNTYLSLGFGDRAQRELREALEIARAVHGPESAAAARARIDLAFVIMDEQPDKAEPEFAGALQSLERAGPDADDARAAAMNALGVIAGNRGKGTDAERYYRDALAIRRRLFGDTSSSVAETINNLAVQAQERSDLAEAEKLYREALRIVRANRGDNDPGTATALSNLAGVVHSQGKLDEAQALYDEVLPLRRKLLGAEHPSVALTEFNYADLLLARGEYARVLSLTDGILSRRGKSLPADHRMIPAALLTAGRARLALGDGASAERDIRDALALRRKILPAGHWLLANTESILGECLMVRGNLAEAERLLVGSYERLNADRGPDHERTRDARARLARLYRTLGRASEAAKYEARK